MVIPSRGVTINLKLRRQIHIIEEYKAKNYLPLVYEIQNKLFNAASSHGVYLQFIPGHKGVSGNEAAKNVHFLWYCTLTPSSYEETKILTYTVFKTKWKTEWLRGIQLTEGTSSTENSGQYSGSAHKTRYVETALARLRVGPTGLRVYHQLGRLVSESACERKDPGSNPAADMVDAARNTAWDLVSQDTTITATKRERTDDETDQPAAKKPKTEVPDSETGDRESKKKKKKNKNKDTSMAEGEREEDESMVVEEASGEVSVEKKKKKKKKKDKEALDQEEEE
ncbi:hypothetical protein FHG87_009512 [Trinorchestia longiramus]|nr:hypothetical protein FHG87_009512 [Trinorchestia longiramus]